MGVVSGLFQNERNPPDKLNGRGGIDWGQGLIFFVIRGHVGVELVQELVAFFHVFLVVEQCGDNGYGGGNDACCSNQPEGRGA